jgi:hypothetical protein
MRNLESCARMLATNTTMKRMLSFYLSLWLFLMLPGATIGQEGSGVKGSENATILWRISGKDCKQFSYLLGTYHLSDAEWLYEYPEIRKVIDSTTFILTEGFSTFISDSLSTHTSQLKAIPLLTNHQYQTLDSFFVARVGEGIKGNSEAENMTVAEMGSAILITLVADSKGANAVTKYMDFDIFTLYRKLGRSGDRLDIIKPTEFNSNNIEHAKQHLKRSLGYIKNSYKPDWNIYQTKGADSVLANYKQMKLTYDLNGEANFDTSDDFDFIPMEVRNQAWMSKIVSNISKQPCLIAVGQGHLRYRIGLISLLRERGYAVEPVMLGKN